MPADVKTGLPQLDLQPGATVTVTCDDPGAVIARLIVYVYQTVPEEEQPLPDVLLAHTPGPN